MSGRERESERECSKGNIDRFLNEFRSQREAPSLGATAVMDVGNWGHASLADTTEMKMSSCQAASLPSAHVTYFNSNQMGKIDWNEGDGGGGSPFSGQYLGSCLGQKLELGIGWGLWELKGAKEDVGTYTRTQHFPWPWLARKERIIVHSNGAQREIIKAFKIE